MLQIWVSCCTKYCSNFYVTFTYRKRTITHFRFFRHSPILFLSNEPNWCAKVLFKISLFHASTFFVHAVSKHVEARIIHIVKQILCINLVNYSYKYTEIQHDQQNVITSLHFECIEPRRWRHGSLCLKVCLHCNLPI